MQTTSQKSSGFTLIELALAIVVVMIGVMALFALISSGLDSSNKAVADTQAGLFAEAVFNGLGAMSQAEAQKGLVGTEVAWRRLWYSLQQATTNIIIPCSTNVWQGTATGLTLPRPRFVYANNTLQTMTNLTVRQHPGTVSGVVFPCFRYRLSVTPTMSLNSLTALSNSTEAVTLRVWDGEFGSTNDLDAKIFYSEFDNPGDL